MPKRAIRRPSPEEQQAILDDLAAIDLKMPVARVPNEAARAEFAGFLKEHFATVDGLIEKQKKARNAAAKRSGH